VDVMAASPVPFLFFYHLDAKRGLAACRIQNDAIAGAVAQYPRRLAGLGVVPLQDVTLAMKELERIVRDLNLPGIEIATNVLGVYPGDEQFWPFWEAVQGLDAVVFVHPVNPLGIDKLGQYHLRNLLGNPFDTTRSIADFVFSGLLEAYPRLKLCFSHAGGTIPYILGRLDQGYRVRPEARARISRPPSEYIGTMYFDTITHGDPALEFLVNSMGANRVVLGSDYPFDMGPTRPERCVDGVRGLSGPDRRKILELNAAELLKLHR
jgi:aminocarboxymuconate-semialdehyde decarboxylase